MNLPILVAAVLIGADEPKKPLFATVDFDRGETVEVRLPAVDRRGPSSKSGSLAIQAGRL